MLKGKGYGRVNLPNVEGRVIFDLAGQLLVCYCTCRSRLVDPNLKLWWFGLRIESFPLWDKGTKYQWSCFMLYGNNYITY